MFSATVLGVESYDALWFVVLVSVVGVVVDRVSCLAEKGVLDSHVGMRFLPLSPIYGFGGTEHRRLDASYEGDAL